MVRFRAVIQGTTAKIHKTTPFTTQKVNNVKYTHHRCYVKVIISCARLQKIDFLKTSPAFGHAAHLITRLSIGPWPRFRKRPAIIYHCVAATEFAVVIRPTRLGGGRATGGELANHENRNLRIG
jgi:hypothetical protein